MDKDLLNLISGELNVHKINLVKSITKQENWVLKKEGKIEIALDTTITKELVFQGILREIIHQIQSIRKQANLSPGKIVSIKWNTSDKDLLDVMSKNKETIEKETNVKLHFIKDIFGQEFSISRKKIQLALGK